MSTALWSQYWAAMRAGDVVAMGRVFAQIESAERVERARRSTVRSLAITAALLEQTR